MADGLTLDQVTIRSPGGQVLVAVSAHVAPGEVLSVMGPSGSGKSTLMGWLTGTLAPVFTAQGRAILNGHDITHLPPQDRGLGLLFQDHVLFPHLSVAGNLAFGLKDKTDRDAAIAAALGAVGLDGFGDRDPATLSGGQRARVALMRMLLARPRAMLLDEPFSRLDVDRRAQMRDLVFGEARKRGLPVVLVTHDAEDAQAAGGRVLRLGQ